MNKPDQSIISSLLEKHSLGICTPEEMALLRQWYAAFPEKGQVWHNDDEKAVVKELLKADIFEAIAQEKVVPVTHVERKKGIIKIWWQAAAVVAVLLGVYLFYNELNYKKDSAKPEPEAEYFNAVAPAGKGNVQLHLFPDHSEAILEPGTTLHVKKGYGTVNREIELLDGMAYFTVQKNAQLPFIVKTPGGLQTKVLGTEFTVKAYSQLEDVQVMVTSGTVQVANGTGLLGTLKADQQLSYDQKTHVVTRTEGKLIDWRKGDLALRNASFAEVARILETRFGLQVEYNKKAVADYSFTLRINKQTTAEEMLEMIKEISGLSYDFGYDKVTIHSY
jgi:transmembrane sensor